MSYLPPDKVREEYAGLCERKKPTLNQKIKMWSAEKKFPAWCRDMKSIVEHRRMKNAKAN